MTSKYAAINQTVQNHPLKAHQELWSPKYYVLYMVGRLPNVKKNVVNLCQTNTINTWKFVIDKPL